MMVRKTQEVARELGVSYYRIISLLRSEKLVPPQKDASGDYIWAVADLEAARRALLIGRRRREANNNEE